MDSRLNERITFIDHGDNLKINVSANKAFYKTRDSVSLNIRVTDNKDLPVSGNLSLAVTDDGQVKSNQYDENILSRFLLTSDLKGYVEEPGYYYPAKSKLIWAGAG